MSGFNFDEVKVAEALLNLPFGTPGGKSAHDAMMHPGNCVKSNETENGMMPKWFGRIVKYSDDEVIVVSHNDGMSKRFVWTGTSTEYFRTRRCD
jgi:hypothetical protein